MILLSTKEEFQFVCTSVSRYCWRYWLLCIYVACVRLAIFHRLNGLFFGLNYQKNIRIFIMQFTFQKETKKKRTHIKAIHHTAWHIYTLSLLQGKTKQSNAKGEARQQREREKKNWINRRLQFIELGGAQQQGIYLSHVRDKLALGFFPSTSLSSMHVYSALFI